MATPAAEVLADGQPVRVTSPDRLIYPATESTPEITKLQVVEYYASVHEGIMRALGNRPTALERWTTRVTLAASARRTKNYGSPEQGSVQQRTSWRFTLVRTGR